MNLKVLNWNLQDFFVFMDKYKGEDINEMSEQKWQLLTTSFKISKPIEPIRAMRDLILKMDPDICLFTEVGGLESLENFNLHFLNNSFDIVHHNSNSDRGIDLGMLIKKNIKPGIKHKIHTQKEFARGALELRLSLNNKHLHILLTHLKSKLNLKGKDFEGRTQRELEVLRLIEIWKNIKAKDGSESIIAGDLNGIISKEEGSEPELGHFAKTIGLKDVFEHQNTPNFERNTYIYYNRSNEGVFMQLDYFLMPDSLKSSICKSSKVLDFCGNERTNFPKNLAEKRAHPSDHYPVFIELDLHKYFT